MNSIISLQGIEFELLRPLHASLRVSERLNGRDFLDIVETVLTEDSTAEYLLDLHAGQRVVVWDDESQAILILRMENSFILIITVLETSRHFCYVKESDFCIFHDVGRKAEVVPVDPNGRFRPKRT